MKWPRRHSTICTIAMHRSLALRTNPILVLAQMSSNVKHPANPYQSCMRDTHSFHYLLHSLHIHNKSWNGGAKDLRATSFPELRTTQDSVFEFQAVAWQVWSRVVAPEVIANRKKCAAKPRSNMFFQDLPSKSSDKCINNLTIYYNRSKDSPLSLVYQFRNYVGTCGIWCPSQSFSQPSGNQVRTF